MIDYGFTPPSLSVPAGSQVTWRWVGRSMHTVTGQGFDSGVLSSGAVFRHTFSTEGSFAYQCNIHPDMKGTIVVTKALAGAPPAAAGSDGASGGGTGASAAGGGSADPSAPAPRAAGAIRALGSKLAAHAGRLSNPLVFLLVAAMLAATAAPPLVARLNARRRNGLTA